MSNITSLNKDDYKTLLTTNFQDFFWEQLTPEISKILKLAEQKEKWTISYEVATSCYESLSELLLRVIEIKHVSEKHFIDLANFLKVLPMRQSLCVLSYFDQFSEDNLSVQLYNFCLHDRYDKKSVSFEASEVMVSRFHFITTGQLTISLFSQLEQSQQ